MSTSSSAPSISSEVAEIKTCVEKMQTRSKHAIPNGKFADMLSKFGTAITASTRYWNSFLDTMPGKGYHTKRQKTKKKMTKPGTEWKSCEGQSQSKAKDQKSQSQSQLNKLTVKTGAVIEEYYWLQSQPI
ncbi:hypothetical protein Tco_1132870 [Tanacetum coccineum]|uniref:Uncharacterized protein n=1 Tax=Tanacetum coccineum TaxID=301880 RepID=A0ABQ5JDU0_9ASTR